MRGRSFFAGVTLALIVGGATAFLFIDKRGVAAQGRQPTERATTRAADPNEVDVDTHSVRRGGIERFTVAVDPRGVHLTAVAQLQDKIQGSRYAWFVRVVERSRFNPNEYGKGVFEDVYLNRTIEPTPGAVVRPEFDDVLAINAPAGDYVAELSLLLLPPDFDARGVADVEDLWKLHMLRSARKFTIGE